MRFGREAIRCSPRRTAAASARRAFRPSGRWPCRRLPCRHTIPPRNTSDILLARVLPGSVEESGIDTCGRKNGQGQFETILPRNFSPAPSRRNWPGKPRAQIHAGWHNGVARPQRSDGRETALAKPARHALHCVQGVPHSRVRAEHAPYNRLAPQCPSTGTTSSSERPWPARQALSYRAGACLYGVDGL